MSRESDHYEKRTNDGREAVNGSENRGFMRVYSRVLCGSLISTDRSPAKDLNLSQRLEEG